MRLVDLKIWINRLSKEELEMELLVKSDFSSGIVQEVNTAEENLYYMADEDPAELITEKEMQKMAEDEGWDDDEYPETYVLKGDYYLSF